jgi:light-regulated signal transduction histidine kinase (bacteriophytochrome)
VSYGNLPDVMADSTQLVQVFQNLIINGIKFHSEEAPKIHLYAEKKRKNGHFFTARAYLLLISYFSSSFTVN